MEKGAFDPLSPKERSERMSRVRSKGTKPEIIVRQIICSLGYKYRLHSKELPGQPDIVFAKKRKVIFVHGCFWHLHEGCSIYRHPRSKLEFWAPKLQGNLQRDLENQLKLHQLGWSVLVIWECEVKNIKNRPALWRRIYNFLEGNKP
ncbi:MAG: very short patch repair endonuclease [Firmicutes bacterium]|nr:very short patch repair endonuclease [Bacillota bacterium]